LHYDKISTSAGCKTEDTWIKPTWTRILLPTPTLEQLFYIIPLFRNVQHIFQGSGNEKHILRLSVLSDKLRQKTNKNITKIKIKYVIRTL